MDTLQETRRLILEILRERGQATVDDIVSDLQQRRGRITAVTVRHHLMRLQQEDLITTPELRRRNSPGRPQHTYSLTEKAQEFFPNNYQKLTAALLEQLHRQLPTEGVNVILEGVASHMAEEAHIPNLPLQERLNAIVCYLSERGYEASWERGAEGYVLHTVNCPYHQANTIGNSALCNMDMRLVAALLGAAPQRLSRLSAGDTSCSYLIPLSAS